MEALHQTEQDLNNDIGRPNLMLIMADVSPSLNHNLPPDRKSTLMYPIQDVSHLTNSDISNETFDDIKGITKLVDYTKDLISNKDVYDINKAAEMAENNLFQPTSGDDQQNAASIGQKQQVNVQSQQSDLELTGFGQPIIVLDENEGNVISATSAAPPPLLEVNIIPYDQTIYNQPKEKPSKQINVQIIESNPKKDNKVDSSNGQNEAPSRQFLKQFKNFKLSKSPTVDSPSHTTTTSTIQTTTVSAYSTSSSGITPRPIIPNKFLAPIQVGLRLSEKHSEDCLDEDHDHKTSEKSSKDQEKTFVDVQTSSKLKDILINREVSRKPPAFGARFVPISRNSGQTKYLGVQSTTSIPSAIDNSVTISNNKISQKSYVTSTNDQQTVETVDKTSPVEIEKQVIIPYTVNNFVQKFQENYDQAKTANENSQSNHYKANQPLAVEKVVEKIIDRPVPYPVEIEKIVDRPYPVERVVEKLIDRPIEVEKIVEKEIKVPYPVKEFVEKIVDRPVEVEKIVEKPVLYPYPVEVQKIIDRPYPVEKIVEKPIHIPYPVEKYIDRPVHVEKIIEKKIEVPIDRIIEKIINVPVHIPYEKIIDRPYPVEKIVEKIVDRPIAVQVQVPVPVHVPYAVHIPVRVPEASYSFTYGAPYGAPRPHYAVIKSTLPQYNTKYKNSKHIFLPNLSNHYIGQHNSNEQYGNSVHHSLSSDCDQPTKSTILHPVQITPNNIQSFSFSPIKPKPIYGVPDLSTNLHGNRHKTYAENYGYKDDYLGPPPLKNHFWQYDNTLSSSNTKLRKTLNFGKSMRWEYGFKPPMRPSVEIDEHGNPINRQNNY